MRFRFMNDDDGHWYLIPAGEEKQFEKWLKAGPYWENYNIDDKDYEGCRIGGSPSDWTFEEPRLDYA